MLHTFSNTLLLFCIQLQVNCLIDDSNTWIVAYVEIMLMHFCIFPKIKVWIGGIKKRTF